MSEYLPPKFGISAHAFTHVGMKRDHNEDAYLLNPAFHLYLVADGMGGHNSGEIASRMAVETIDKFFQATLTNDEITWPFKYDKNLSDIENRLDVSARLANGHVFQASKRNELYQGMGTTLVGVCFSGEVGTIVNIGDSRAYRWRDGELWQLTTDHSLLNEQLKTHPMTQAEIDNFPHKNIILRALGIKDAVEPDLVTYRPQRGDYLLLCSDGLNDMVSDDLIQQVVTDNAHDPKLIPKLLVREANAHGGADNITVLAVHID